MLLQGKSPQRDQRHQYRRGPRHHPARARPADSRIDDNGNGGRKPTIRALTKALKQQSSIGAVQTRLDFTAENITIAHENVTASESTIRDADMAKTFTEYSKANILTQTAQSMLAQANQNSSSVLGLLQ